MREEGLPPPGPVRSLTVLSSLMCSDGQHHFPGLGCIPAQVGRHRLLRRACHQLYDRGESAGAFVCASCPPSMSPSIPRLRPPPLAPPSLFCCCHRDPTSDCYPPDSPNRHSISNIPTLAHASLPSSSPPPHYPQVIVFRLLDLNLKRRSPTTAAAPIVLALCTPTLGRIPSPRPTPHMPSP